ncbi:unnamed protein product [Bursaphelenchus okinawaensis]|uniref:Actin maturation protease n=1 Tax=Bursaphelenchus okinawaensis TaxID=465554 RepID=A0A811LAK8_9BILA|nr:unnamed protein product [Bursaphelenchus okinawaensis]CAG9119691.1 unnamed protein product [Bursaphelenchus okinawaensis]
MEAFGTLFKYRLEALRSINDEESFSGFLSTVEPITINVQKGPTCGPVAQVVVSKVFETEPFTVDEVVYYNKSEGYTSSGECFSVDWMTSSLSHFMPQLQLTTTVLPPILKLLTSLDNNTVYIVPYDADKDNSPGFCNGKSAHWCVIVGYFVRHSKGVEFDVNGNFNDGDVFVVAYQGKSRNPALWSYADLQSSNCQLNTYEKPAMIMDAGGIEAGLKGRAVRVEGVHGHYKKMVNFRM